MCVGPVGSPGTHRSRAPIPAMAPASSSGSKRSKPTEALVDRSELLCGEREHAFARRHDRVLQGARLRQEVVGIKTGRGDLGPIELGVILALAETLRGDERRARHLPTARSDTP